GAAVVQLDVDEVSALRDVTLVELGDRVGLVVAQQVGLAQEGDLLGELLVLHVAEPATVEELRLCPERRVVVEEAVDAMAFGVGAGALDDTHGVVATDELDAVGERTTR